MIAALLAGLIVGLGGWLAVTTYAPARPSLAAAIRRLDRAPEPPPSNSDDRSARCGRAVLRITGSRSHSLAAAMRRDLDITGIAPETHLGRKVLGSAGGLLMGPAIVGVLAAVGASVPIAVPAWVCALGAAGGWFLPGIELRRQATARRREFRQSLGAYSDLVVLLLAADEGVTGALEQASYGGDSWPFVEIRRVLSESRLTAATPWASLRGLGDRFGVSELEELASAAQLAGSEGASVRQSLIAKARTLRDRALAAEEAHAEQASTRMVFPLMLLVCSFLVFVGYPALSGVLSS